MAKMFYTLEEVAAKLKKSPDEVRAMAKSGQLQEFRDRDKLMFKVDQIDLLAGDEDTGPVQLDLEETSGGSAIGLASSGSGLDLKEDSAIGLADSREGTGISVFDTDHGRENVSGETQVGETVEDELSIESVGSGSGLLDLTRESDDTSLGAELLEEVYSGDSKVEMPANASGLFQAAAESPDDVRVSGMAMPVMVEAYDGAGSGLGIGLLLGSMAALICTAIIVIVGAGGATSQLAITFSGNIWMWVGILAGVTLILGIAGFIVGKASE